MEIKINYLLSKDKDKEREYINKMEENKRDFAIDEDLFKGLVKVAYLREIKDFKPSSIIEHLEKECGFDTRGYYLLWNNKAENYVRENTNFANMRFNGRYSEEKYLNTLLDSALASVSNKEKFEIIDTYLLKAHNCSYLYNLAKDIATKTEYFKDLELEPIEVINRYIDETLFDCKEIQSYTELALTRIDVDEMFSRIKDYSETISSLVGKLDLDNEELDSIKDSIKPCRDALKQLSLTISKKQEQIFEKTETENNKEVLLKKLESFIKNEISKNAYLDTKTTKGYITNNKDFLGMVCIECPLPKNLTEKQKQICEFFGENRIELYISGNVSGNEVNNIAIKVDSNKGTYLNLDNLSEGKIEELKEIAKEYILVSNGLRDGGDNGEGGSEVQPEPEREKEPKNKQDDLELEPNFE